MRAQPLISAVVLLACSLPVRASDAQADGLSVFESKIRPILVEQCYKCHSAQADKLKGGLRLDSRVDVLKGGKDGPVLIPGDPDHSRLIEAIRWTDPDLQMPPKHRLSAQQVADFAQWVRLGAPDPRGAETPAANLPVAAPTIDYTAARRSWAWSIPKDHPVPPVKEEAWCKSPIDRFILAKLDEKGLKAAPPADKRTLIRRAYFDLIGLPPEPDEVEAFVADESPDAFARVIDRLLASPHYGERWGRHWLDVVRYADAADSRSVKGDTISPGDISEAWRYRDWVVKAFNEDLPYDQFVMNQIAGDLLPAKHPGEFNDDGLVATGMYVIGNWPGGDADKEKMMTDIVDDQIDVTGRAFLGMTLACARCHDHKFDPISTRDYYGMAGIFFSTHILPSPGEKTAGSPVLRVAMESQQQQEARKQHEARLAELQKTIERQTDEAYAKLARGMLPRSDRYVAAVVDYWKQDDHTSAVLDSLAKKHKVDPFVLSRWVDYLTPMLRGQPPRKLMTESVRNIAGIAGVDGWKCPDGRDCPNAAINSTDHPVSFLTITLPARCVSVHPGPSTGAAVGWTSPICGSVSIRGKVIDADPNGGDGIDWRIEHARQRGVETLASGAFPNGGSQAFDHGEGARLNSIDVKPDDVLQLTVFPKAEYTCDTTVIELEIAETGGEHRVWNLARDIVPDPLVGGQGNPHADSYGNPRVWQFFEAGEERGTSGAPPDSVLAHWLAHPSDRREDAQEIHDTLLALEDRAEEAKQSGKKDLGVTGPDVKLYQDVTAPRGPMWGPVRSDAGKLPDADREQIVKLQAELTSLRKQSFPPVTYANAMAEGGTPQSEYEGVHDWYVLTRGRYDHKAERVPRCFPRLLAGDHQPPISHGSGRLQLAKWVASPDNPMTAKVMANRIWQHHFGEGIVSTPNNYGKLGTPPTHSELLDWLALRFIDSGWSIKSMHRMIMLSAAYQQSSEGDPATMKVDPGNELFGRMNRQRLEAEPMRDAMLAVTNTLDQKLGGPSTANLNTPRRTLYLMTVRSDRANYRMLFDAPDPTGIADHRIDSTVAPQALFLMNSPFVVDKAKRLAARVMSEAGDERTRMDRVYRLLYSRAPTAKELEIGLKLLQQSGGSTPAAWEQYCQVLLCANEFVYVD